VTRVTSELPNNETRNRANPNVDVGCAEDPAWLEEVEELRVVFRSRRHIYIFFVA
jgi:hypothetical protein